MILFLLFLLIVDATIIPFIASLPNLFVQHKSETLSYILNSKDYLQYIRILKEDPVAFKIWLYIQPLLALFFYFTFFNKRFSDRNRKGTIGGPQAVGNGEYGTAKWAKENELDKTSTIWKFGQEAVIGGILIGANLVKKYIWTVVEDVHTLVIGSTRSGKSRRWVFPTIWRLGYAGESMILTDPKGELHARSKKFLEKKGYEVVCIDFRNGTMGNFWNPMHAVNKAIAKEENTGAAKAASSIAHMFVHQSPDSKKGEQTWNNGAESVLASMILSISNDAPDEKFKHMTSVYRTLGELGEPQIAMMNNKMIEYVPLNEYMKELGIDHPARDAFMSARIATDRMRGSFFTQVLTLLKNFSDPTIQNLTSKQDHELEDIGKKKTAVFLVIPDEDTTRHVLASLYVEQAYQALVKTADENNGRLPVRVNMILDEFGNMPPIKDFATKLTVSGGRGVRWHLIVQDFQQLEKNYQADADTIKGNCHTWIYILTASMKTAKELSERLGDYTIRTEGGSVTDSKNVSVSANYGKAARKLLKEDELLKLPENKAVIFRLRRDPAYVDYPDLSFYPADEELEISEIETHTIEKTPFFVPTKKYHLRDFNTTKPSTEQQAAASLSSELKSQESIITHNNQQIDTVTGEILNNETDEHYVEDLFAKFDRQISMDRLSEDPTTIEEQQLGDQNNSSSDEEHPLTSMVTEEINFNLSEDSENSEKSSHLAVDINDPQSSDDNIFARYEELINSHEQPTWENKPNEGDEQSSKPKKNDSTEDEDIYI